MPHLLDFINRILIFRPTGLIYNNLENLNYRFILSEQVPPFSTEFN
jgi:hypothetical protein